MSMHMPYREFRVWSTKISERQTSIWLRNACHDTKQNWTLTGSRIRSIWGVKELIRKENVNKELGIPTIVGVCFPVKRVVWSYDLYPQYSFERVIHIITWIGAVYQFSFLPLTEKLNTANKNKRNRTIDCLKFPSETAYDGVRVETFCLLKMLYTKKVQKPNSGK